GDDGRRHPARAARWLRGGDLAPLHAGAAPLPQRRHRGRRRSRNGGAAVLRRLGQARAAPGSSDAAGGAQRVAPGAALRGHRPVSGAGSAAVTVAIVDYGSGNLHSAAKAFERAAREAELAQPIVVTSDPDTVARADPVVPP